MKKLGFTVVGLLGVLLLTPPLLGMRAQDQLEQSIARMAAQSGAYVDISLIDYESSWFASHGKIHFRLSEAYLAANPLLQQELETFADAMSAGFSQHIDVMHGPILLDEQTSIGLGTVVSTIDGSASPILAKSLAEVLAKTGNEYFLRSSMTFGFTGMGDITIDAPPFQIDKATDELASIVFAGADASGSFDLTDLHVVIDGQLNGLSFIGDLGEAVLEGVSFSADMAYPDSDPYGLGQGEMMFDRLVAINEDQTSLDLTSAKIAFTSIKTDTNKVALSFTYALDAFNAPGTRLRDMQLTFTLANLQPETLIELQRLGNTLVPDPNDPTQTIKEMMDPFYELLAGGASLSVDPIGFIYNDQPFHAALKVQSKPSNLPAKDAFTFDNPMVLMNLFVIDAELSIDTALALDLTIPQLKQQLTAGVPEGTEITDAELEDMARAQAPMVLGTLIGQGMLRTEDSNYLLKARYDNGELTVNGNPFPLGAVLGQSS